MPSDRTTAALDDLAELEQQHREGLVDDATADRLFARYAREALDHAATQPEDGPPDHQPGPARRSPWVRRLGLVTLAGAVAGAVTVGLETSDRAPGEFVTGNEAVAAPSGRDLSEVTNQEMEEVVAQNPDIVPMRLRLGHRYLDDGDLDRAVDHYLEVLDRENHPEAMSHLGWILFLDGRTDLAAPLLEESRQLDPQDLEARWFHANVLLYGQDDPGAAVPLLEGLLGAEDLGDTQRSEVASVLQDARARLEEPS